MLAVYNTTIIKLTLPYSILLLNQPRIHSSSAKAPTLNMTREDPEIEIAFGISPITRA